MDNENRNNIKPAASDSQASGAEFCSVCRGRTPQRIDMGRVLTRLDRLLADNEIDAARKHLEYWRAEAIAMNDSPARLTLTNELMGFSRRYGERDEAVSYAEEGIHQAESDPEFADTSFLGTTWLNAATVYKTFDMPEKAVELYRKAEVNLTEKLESGDHRLAGLYNNLGLALADLGEYAKARESYEKALDVDSPDDAEHAPDRAITLLNMADLLVYERGSYTDGAPSFAPEDEAEGDRLLELAFKTLTGPEVPRDDYFVYVCERCAKVFGDYGYFLYRNELQEAADEVRGKRG